MAKLDAKSMIKKLNKATEDYLSVIAEFEDAKLDQNTRDQVTSIIQENQIHENIALDEIQN